MSDKPQREGSLEAPTRHPIDWQDETFYDPDDLNTELERVFEICHGCRRCVNLCDAFPTLFDLVDESDTLEVDGVDKADFSKVTEQCYLCDMCYMTKCPYVPPHPWNVDFPHLMLRAKAVSFRQHQTPLRDRLISNTDAIAKLATIPLLDITVNAANKNPLARRLLEKNLHIHRDANLPVYHHQTMRKRVTPQLRHITPHPGKDTRGQLALFATCYGNYNEPQVGEDLVAVMQYNDIPVRLTPAERCCGMPKLELGDLESVAAAMRQNVPMLAELVDQGCDLTAVMPSCVLMFRQELPLLFPDDEAVAKVAAAFYDPFEYLWRRHRSGMLKTDFQYILGDISYQIACHLRVQNVGIRARDVLQLVPDTRVHAIERCSGHDGTYGVKSETYDKALKIGRPVARKLKQQQADYFASDCPMAATHIASMAEGDPLPHHPLSLLRIAYGI
ncbi:heterodisulfide reductase-related iron-sulfur binding cluster [Marinobacterium jannaschii]|uniref:heterodisulfide reductase-related iron-sulfur binding cluster n=1 Tax=Marinobacterium jannaschii TaxID=64970 RepID=UPI000482EABF|nr:heterodisulfide reductase-related iron-sulfur binding cluster [Marinobacterium jannaschii]